MSETKNAGRYELPAPENSAFTQDYNINPTKSKERIHRIPIHFHRNPYALPELLKQLDQWCLSGYDKQPLNLSGYPIDVKNSANFYSFQEAMAVVNTTACAGVGFILSSSDNLVVVDVDHCIDESGEFSDIAKDILEILPTYTELSQSKTGLHLIYQDNDVPAEFTGRKGTIEIYYSKHYVALTGWKLEGTPAEIASLNGLTKRLLEKYFPNLGYSSSANFQDVLEKHSYSPVQSNNMVLQSLQSNQKFQRLYYQGDIAGYPSQSEADGALMLILATATALNATQMRELFSQSALGKRNKWMNRRWYQDYLINGAINFSAQINPGIVAAFTLVSITDTTPLTDKLFEAAAICKANPDFYSYYDAFRKYCKQNKQQLDTTVRDFNARLKLAEEKIATEKIQRYNKTVEQMKQLTLPAPYDKVQWIIPEGYKVNAQGIWVMSSSGYKKICESAIFITQEIINRQTGKIKNQLQVFTIGKDWKQYDFVDTKILNNAGLMSLELASQIPTINSGNCNQLVNYLTTFRVINYSNIQQLISTNKLGWNNNVFVTPYNNTTLSLDTTNTFALSLELRGTIEEWIQVTQPVFNLSSLNRFILSAYFVPPLLKPLTARIFSVYIWGSSTFNKSTMMILGNSIWGTDDGIVTFGGTLNGMEVEATERDGFPYTLDDKQQKRDYLDTKQLIMRLGNGKSDGRSSKDITSITRKQWKIVAFMSGEEPITDNTASNGVNTRVIQLPIEIPLVTESLRRSIWKTINNKNCGWAGKIFVEHLNTTDFYQLTQDWENLCLQLQQEFPNHHEEHISYVATVAIAEKLACNWIFHEPSQHLEMSRAILSILETKAALSNTENFWNHLKSWVSKDARCFKHKGIPMGNNECYGEYHKDFLIISQEALEKEFYNWGHISVQKVIADLDYGGYLETYMNPARKSPRKIWYLNLNGTPRVPCIKISLQTLNTK